MASTVFTIGGVALGLAGVAMVFAGTTQLALADKRHGSAASMELHSRASFFEGISTTALGTAAVCASVGVFVMIPSWILPSITPRSSSS